MNSPTDIISFLALFFLKERFEITLHENDEVISTNFNTLF